MPRPNDSASAMSLAQLQRSVMAAITEVAPSARFSAVQPRKGLVPDALLAIYRHAVEAVRLNALRCSYPVVEQLVGTAFFRTMALDYIASTPSQSGDLDRDGVGFSDFIRQFSPASGLPYLPDMARFERLLGQLKRAPDQAPLDVQGLAAMPVEDLAERRIRLVPRAALFHSVHPISAIWRAHHTTETDLESVDLRSGEERLLLVADDSMTITALTDAEYHFYDAAVVDRTLADAVAAALSIDPTLHVTTLFQCVFSRDALCLG
jgi:hypothetical protein